MGRGPQSQDACFQMLVPPCMTWDLSSPLAASFLMARMVGQEACVWSGGRRGRDPGSEVLVTREAWPSSAPTGRKALHQSLTSLWGDVHLHVPLHTCSPFPGLVALPCHPGFPLCLQMSPSQASAPASPPAPPLGRDRLCFTPSPRRQRACDVWIAD